MSTRYFFWGLLVCVALGFSLPLMAEEKPAVSEEAYADLMANEALDIQDLAEGAEIQRRMFNHMTPSGFSWLQPMFPPVAPFDAGYFDEAFLDGLLGEDTNSVAVYPLSLVLDPKTRETLIYNTDGKLIASVPSDGISRTWPEDADPARVTLKIDLLPSEDVEPYLYVEDRVAEATASKSAKTPKSGGVVMMNMMVGSTNFGILDFQRLTNGNMRLTVTNGTDVAEVYSYTVWHTSSVVVVTWTNEESNVVTDTNTLWTPVSPTFNGLESDWECRETNLVLTAGIGVWEDSNISSNARVRFYGVAKRADADRDGLTDGAELFVHHTSPTNADTDGDGWNDGEEIAAETDPLDRFSATHLAKGVVVNEVLYNPDGADPEKEWVELYSASRYPVELSGFSIQVASNDFSDAYIFSTNTWIQPGHCLLIGGTLVSNRDHTASLTMPNCFTNEPTGAVRLVAEISTNTLVADTLMYGGNPSVFNENGLDTTGWLSTNVPWALAGSSVVRWFAGVDSDRSLDWTWSNTPTPSSSTNSIDSDSDGLTDQQELTGSENPFSEPTNQHNADSDGDGLGDYVECETYGTDPNTWATDGDLFPWPPTNNYAVSNWWGSDPYELANGWDPLIYDENTNGIPDSWEMAFPGTNLYADTDNDGILNYDELVQNSNPFSSNSVSPQPYVVVYQSSKPGWVNNGLVDVGLNGWVKIYFSGLKTNTCLGVWVKECSTQEEFKVEWIDATLNGSVWLNENREVITGASAEANSHPYLLIQDLGLHPDFTNHLGGEYTNAIISVDVKFADPDETIWPDLAEEKVILSDKDTRIKLLFSPQLPDLQTILNAFGTELIIKTSGTAPNGQAYTLTTQNATLVQEGGYSEIRVSLTRDHLKTMDVLPDQESDSVTEKAWLDHGSSSTSDPSNLSDGNAFETGMTAEIRGKSTNYGNLESNPPNSPISNTFFVAAGREIIVAEYGKSASHKRQLMNQADNFYYSGHGSHADATLQGGFSPSDVTDYWNKDLDVAIIAGCAVLDIKDYRAQSFGILTKAEWLFAGGDWSPGAQWEPKGPQYFLGYNWTAPLDNQGSAGIISNFLSARSGGESIINAWKQANDLGTGRNACVIDVISSPHVYWYWDETSGPAVWTNITKSGGSW